MSSLNKDQYIYDPEIDQIIDLEKCHSDYRRFNSRYDDDELEINDVINCMIPSQPETSNIIQFELILLESGTIERDYVVGWGVFPLLNSEFVVNEGKFKCPLMFGAVDVGIDKFTKIEEKIAKDLDNWLCNLYFEIEKVNLMDIKADDQTDKLYFSPVYKVNRKKKAAISRQKALAVNKGFSSRQSEYAS